MLRKWSGFCISLDFEANEAQVALNGKVALKIKNPATSPNKFNRFDGKRLEEDHSDARFVFRFGRYFFDGNPFIGRMTGIAAWPKVLTEQELGLRSSCSPVSLVPGSLLSSLTSWSLTASLVTEEPVPEAELACGGSSGLVTAHLPVPSLSWQEAVELCARLGSDVYMAGDFRIEADFAEYYKSLQANPWYHSACGYIDNGRIKTWLPYVINSTGTGLQHSVTGNNLFAPSYYAPWYGGPKTEDLSQCGAAYFGLVSYGSNIHTDSCSASKCTACALHNSHSHTSSVTLRGLCRFSGLDTHYTVHYSPDLGISYHGLQRSIITYSRGEGAWKIEDMTDSTLLAVSKATFRSLALGKHIWKLSNDTGCSPDPLETWLALTSCSQDQFTCRDGLCLARDQRCDGQPQCRDSSDELRCSVIEEDLSYNRSSQSSYCCSFNF